MFSGVLNQHMEVYLFIYVFIYFDLAFYFESFSTKM